MTARTNMLRLSLFIIIACVMPSLCLSLPAKAQVDDTGSQPNVTDTNDITPANLRQLYFNRYPFAQKQNQSDQVNNQQSQSGSQVTGSSPAYTQMERTCKEDSAPNPPTGRDEHYHQPQDNASVTPASARDQEAVNGSGMIKTYSYPVSDTQFQVIDRECRQRFIEQAFDPQRWVWTQTMNSQMQSSSMANGVANAAETTFGTALNAMDTPLANVANELTGMSSDGQSQAIHIIQQMYKTVFIPLAVLLLLPGALLTQLKGSIAQSLHMTDEDAGNPFAGMMRGMVAIFLIPATQLIVSYAIDIGNTMTNCIQAGQWIDVNRLTAWAGAQNYGPQLTNNAVIPPTSHPSSDGSNYDDGDRGADDGSVSGGSGSGSGGAAAAFTGLLGGTSAGQFTSTLLSNISNVLGWSNSGSTGGSSTQGQGKNLGEPEGSVDQEDQLFLSSMMCIAFNSSSYMFSGALTILTAYQLVLVSYLMLLGPIAACFYAWPGGAGGLFRNIFGNWLNALIVLVLWKFYWCAILAIMTQRLVGCNPNPNSPWEMMIFNCFLCLLLFVPFQPFNFNPGAVAAAVLDKASQALPQSAG